MCLEERNKRKTFQANRKKREYPIIFGVPRGFVRNNWKSRQLEAENHESIGGGNNWKSRQLEPGTLSPVVRKYAIISNK